MIESIDQKLLDRVLRGDRAPFAEIFEAYFEDIRRFIFFRTGRNDHLADDLASSIFVKFFEYVARGNTVDHVRGFLYQSARNEVTDYFRTRKESVDIDDEIANGIGEDAKYDEHIDFQLDSKKALSCLDRLKDDWKEVVILRFLKEMEYEEIALITGKTEGAIRVIIHRSLKELREMINSL